MSDAAKTRRSAAAENAGDLAEGILAGERRALARAITLVESTRAEDQNLVEDLLASLLPATGKALRLGISGAPGAGKSNFIEAFGRHVLAAGKKLAVLAIDPSSPVSGGSILGDKTRMAELARQPGAFIRPSPGGGMAGGIARRSYETLLLCEAAGYDLVIVETIGIGQSETLAADLVDLFLLLISPAGGDALQGIKRGIMEFADLVIVTKADGDLAQAASRILADMAEALRLLGAHSGGNPVEALACSALEDRGLAEIWAKVAALTERGRQSGAFARRRADQARSWFRREVRENLATALMADPELAERWPSFEAEIAAARLAPLSAARRLVEAFLAGRREVAAPKAKKDA